MDKSIRVSTDLLNLSKIQNDQCLVDGYTKRIAPDEFSQKVINGGIYDKAKEYAHSPLYDFAKEVENQLGNTDLTKNQIKELTLFGEGRILNLKWLLESYEYDAIYHKGYSINNLFHEYGKRILRIENEVEELQGVDSWHFSKDEGSAGYFCYINNFVENIKIENVDKDANDHFFYRAPKENTTPVDGKLLELTLAPRATFMYGDKRWCAPIIINADSVSCIYPSEAMDCYDSAKHEGCRIVLFGKNLDKEILDRYEKRERWPVITVWESYDFVLNKLRQAGWNK